MLCYVILFYCIMNCINNKIIFLFVLDDLYEGGGRSVVAHSGDVYIGQFKKGKMEGTKKR